jgi:hypothetical protein
MKERKKKEEEERLRETRMDSAESVTFIPTAPRPPFWIRETIIHI